MKILTMVATICFLIGTTNSLTYPIFGIKRYNLGVVSQRSEMPAYENGYLTNNGYYYFPQHEYHSYGMPTYRGEYKPKAYYYSSGPSYNYYNDRMPVSNPLDDLHEEILQENEQERQSDLLQGDDYEYYYIDHDAKVQNEKTTNNFLRNMMEYNRDSEKQHRLHQLHYKQRDQLDQEKLKDDDYFPENEVNPDDYQFEPQGVDNFDLQKYWDAEQKYWDAEHLSMNKGVTSTDSRYFTKLENMLNNNQDVRNPNGHSQHEPENSDEDYKKRYNNNVKQPHLNSWTHQKSTESPLTSKQKDFEGDYSPADYDDDLWINWDRKRNSSPNKNQVLNKDKLNLQKKSQTTPSINSQNKQSVFQNQLPASTSIRSATLSSIAYGQKENYPGWESNAANTLDINNEENSSRNLSKKWITLQKRIYETIKKMIVTEQELKKNEPKIHTINKSGGGSVVKQLDSLKKL